MQELRGRGDVSQPVDKDVTMAFPVWYISINCHLSQAGVGKPELLCQHMHRAPLGSHRQGSWQRWWFMRQFSGFFFLERESGKKNTALLSIPIVTSGWVIDNGGGGGGGEEREVGNAHTFYLQAGESGDQVFPLHWFQPEAPSFTHEFNSHVVVLGVDNLFFFPCSY